MSTLSATCPACVNGDHSHHQPAFGGICVGCVCAERPPIQRSPELAAAIESAETDLLVALVRAAEAERLRLAVFSFAQTKLNATLRDELLALFEVPNV